ncbi:T9SS type A sorting domain-containing protein [Hymenobacter sp. IS2118]|uniref:T9SS type A sorting domain-containing protein n=1 Tax=Hymenobacter sp. IS2118 TaxID=1505605 RepID=UPI000557BACF|nr:T9SS type A sorting domain-containing protein [Hymenobacter sp. IS2118]
MKKYFTLSALAALALSSLSAQAQFTVDGTLSPTEVGTGTGKYQLLGTYTGTHSIADRGLKDLYVGVTATTLNIMVVASPEIDGYNSMLFYLDVPNKTGIAAGTRLPGSSNDGNGGRESLRQRPTLDMPVDYGFRLTTSPFGRPNENAIYLSRVDYTVAPGANGYNEIGMGAGKKDGTLTTDANDPAGAKTAFQTSATGSVAANTSTGWELEIPLSALGGLATGSNLRMMAAYIDDFRSFNSDVLPQIAGRTTALGIDPDFTAIAGDQFYTYQVNSTALATRTGSAPALQAAAYPNPVAAASRLAYTVPVSAQPVTVEVYNSLGQKSLSLVNATQNAGRHEVALASLQNLAAGPYLVTLRVGQQLSRHRVVVE